MKVQEILAEAAGGFDLSLPKGNRGIEVADLQKALIAFGYPLPKFGVDGIRGRETSAAIRKFQQDHKLAVDGIPGPQTIEMLNDLLDVNPKVSNTLKKSTPADVKVKGPVRLPPMAQDAVTQGKVGELLNFIARYESRGNYNVVFGMKPDPKLTSMTIADVLNLQDQHVRSGSRSSAAGRYQYIRKTLRDTIAQMGINPSKTLYNETTQDSIAIFTLRSIGLDNWLSGAQSDAQFLNRVAKIWAGIPTATGGGVYDGDGLNKAGTTSQNALMALQNIKAGQAVTA